LTLRLRLWIPSTPSALKRAVARVRRLASRCGRPEDDQADIEIALREALANAICHGNSGRARQKIFVRCYGGPGAGVLIAVRDQGRGFDPDGVPDPREDDRLFLHHGRGLLLMRELMDRVEFRKGGREVVLYKRGGP
jgi:serine/threonine-protein kinase RsbW